MSRGLLLIVYHDKFETVKSIHCDTTRVFQVDVVGVPTGAIDAMYYFNR